MRSKVIRSSKNVAGKIVLAGATASALLLGVGSRVTPTSFTAQVTAASATTNLTSNIDQTTTVSPSQLANAKGDGPFTAGVNQVIPFEAFGGDGMLTRLLLNSAAKAPWSDNGTAKNPALPPVASLSAGQYFYEVDFGGNLAGKTGQALIDQLHQNGNQSYQADVKVYAAGSDGKADTSKTVATKTVTVQVLANLVSNINASTTVSASQLANAKGDGPFTAGVNQVIPFEAFGGDGMLTRLLLNSAAKAPWSDNGTAKNPALAPVAGLTAGQYFYEVDFGGNLAGKTGQALIDQLRQNGAQSYQVTVKVYAAGADGKADTSKVVATKTTTVSIGKAAESFPSQGIVITNQNTPVYRDANGAATGRQLAPGTSWRAFTTTVAADGSIWYNLGGQQYVSAKDVTFTQGDAKTSTAVNRVVTINYTPGYGIALWQDDAGQHFAHRYLATGSKWRVSRVTRWANGRTFYQVGTNQWIDARYAK